MKQLVQIFLLNSFSFFLYGSTAPTNAHFCLVNSSGNVATGCSGPPLIKANLKYFKDLYPDRKNPPKAYEPSVRIFNPLIGQSASQLSNQMLFKSDLDSHKLQALPIFLNWSRLPVITAFGGAVSEAQVVFPPRFMRDKSRVKATIFFPPDAYGGKQLDTQVAHMLDPESDVAESLVDAAMIYGVDEYFINGESSYCQSHKKEFGAFIETLRSVAAAKNFPLQIEWYVVSSVDMDDMVIAPGTDKKVTSTIFIDHFIWDVFFKAWLSLPAKDQSIYNPKDVEYGAYDVSELREILKNYAGNSSVSYFNYNAIPCPQPTDFMNDEESQIARLRNFWKEFAPFFPAQTINYSFPFSTWFNVGMGRQFAIRGTQVRKDHWSCLELQSPLPQLDLMPDTLTYNFDTVYYGGSSLVLNMQNKVLAKKAPRALWKLKKKLCCDPEPMITQSVNLFNNMGMSITSPAELIVYYAYSGLSKTLKQSNAPQICINGKYCYPLQSKKITKKSKRQSLQWEMMTVPLSSKIQEINSISINYSEGNSPAQLYLGGLHIKKPQQVRVLEQVIPWKVSSRFGDGYIHTWKEVPGALAYDLYQGNQFVAETTVNSFWLPTASSDLQVKAVFP